MAIEAPPDQAPGQGLIATPREVNPYSPLWWTTQTITDIPGDTAGWFLANGWIPTDIRLDETTTPPTPYYALTKEALNNQVILLSLLNTYTVAANDAKANNEFRYNQIVANWTALLDSSEDYFDTQVAEQNEHVLLYRGNIDTYMDQIDSQVDSNRNQLVADAAVATTALTAMDAKLGDLEGNVDDNATTIKRLLDDQAGYLDTFLKDFAIKLGELDDNYSAHLILMEDLLSSGTDLTAFTDVHSPQLTALSNAYTAHALVLAGEGGLLETAGTNLTNIATDINAVLNALVTDYTDLDLAVADLRTSESTALDVHTEDYATVVASLESDYGAHFLAAPKLLDDLGTTERERINEEFDATLATQLQQLTDRGLSSAAVRTDIEARNTRDRGEEVAKLNDNLNRQKLANQHTLYGQKTDMRARTLDGKGQVYATQQEFIRYQAAQITGLYQLVQAMRDRTQSGKQIIYGLRDANTRLNIDIRDRLYEAGQVLSRLLIEEANRLHQLQQVVTQWETGQRDKLLEQVQQIESQRLAGIDKQHAAQQDISRVAMSQRDQLLGQLQDAVKGLLAGKERYATMTMQNASTVAEHKHRVIIEKMNQVAIRLEGERSTHADNMKLMAYQLDERNKLLVGLYGFVERREDIGPKFEQLAQVCTALGDAGGGWITP